MKRKSLLAVAVALFVASIPNDGSCQDRSAVLLRNGQVLYGAAKQDGDRILIEETHSSIRLDRREVLCWGPTIDSLYEYRVDHRLQDSYRHHLLDARWCIENGLLSQAASELIAVRALAGDVQEANALEHRLRVMLQSTSAIQQTGAATANGSNRSALDGSANATLSEADKSKSTLKIVNQPIDTQQPRAATELPARLFTTQSLQNYTAHIQPALLNRCATAGCHGSRPSSVPYLDGWRYGVSASITNRNLKELAPYLGSGNPDQSQLMRMAMTPHGGSEVLTSNSDAGLKDRLADWIRSTASVDSNSTPSTSHVPSKTTQGLIAPVRYLEPMNEKSTAPSVPTRLPQVDDPFDPEIFNKLYGAR